MRHFLLRWCTVRTLPRTVLGFRGSMNDEDIADQLWHWHKELKSHARTAAENKANFLGIIEKAREEGWTYSDIADLLDISVSRVQQLVRQADGRGRSS